MSDPKVTSDELQQLLDENPSLTNYGLAKVLREQFGMSHRAGMRRVAKARNAAGVPAPEGHIVRRVTALHGPDGEVKQQWVRSEPEQDAFFKAAPEFVRSLLTNVRPAKLKKVARGLSVQRQCNYNLGDPHIGMLAWHEETGEDFDLQIAERDLTAAVAEAVDCAPPTREARINNFGDYFHVDNNRFMTERGGNVLDADSRYLKILSVGIRTMRTLVDTALTKHHTVRVRNVQGNHDPHSAWTLTLTLQALYENQPRVIIEASPQPFWSYRFGKNLVGLTHGHELKKPEAMASHLPVHDPVGWGESQYRFVWHGHIHHKRLQEHAGVQVESFRTLAGSDYWHTAQGYRAGRELQCVILDKEFGEVSRNTVSLNLARSRAA